MKIDLILLKSMHQAISMQCTGTPENFAKKLGVSLRTLHENREFMIGELSAPIHYCRSRKTYYYADDWELYIGDLNRIKVQLIKEVMHAINHTVKFLVLAAILGF